MKKICRLLLMLVLLFIVDNATAQCTNVTLTMNDSWGDGWNGGSITITNTSGVSYGPYTITGSVGTQNICLPDGCYSINMVPGSYPGEISWSLSNGVSGNGNYGNQSNVFTIGAGFIITMNDSWGDGWNGGSITLSNNLGGSYGPYTISGATGTQSLYCLPDGCYSINVNPGSYPGEMSWSLSNGVSGNGYYGNQSDVFTIGAGSCGPVSGCMNPASANYNPLATIDDGSCYFAVPQTGSNSITECTGSLYDNGGPTANYANGSNGYTVLYPSAGNSMQLTGTHACENNYDYLYIYDGVGITGTLLYSSAGTGSGTVNIGTITSLSGPLTVRFTSDGSVSYAGFDLSLACVTPPPPPLPITPPVCYDMNGNTGGFTNGLGGNPWNNGATTTPSSATGPQGADASGGSGFAFTESSGIYNTTYGMTGDFDLSAGSYQMTFDYHMYGATMGNLRVLVNGAQVFIVSGNQGNTWNSAVIDLSGYLGASVEIAILSTTGTSYTSDCAIDNVCINTCPTPSNNVCANAPILDLGVSNSQTHTGTGCGSTSSLSASYKDVWVAFTVPCGGMDLSIDLCGTSPVHTNSYINIFPDCSFTSWTTANSWEFTSCGDGNITLNWSNVPEGTYYFPILIEPTWETPYVLNITGTPLNVPVTAPTISPMPGTYCPNTDITLSAAGGTSGAGAVINWYSGANGTGTLLGTGANLVVAPNSTTTYYVRREGLCNNSADDAITINTKNYVYAANGTSASNYCTDNNGWKHFYNGDNIIFSVEGDLTGAATGFPVATINNNSTYYQETEGPGTAAGCAFNQNPNEERFEMSRSWNLDFGGGTQNGNYSIRFYYPPAEKTAIENAANAWMANYVFCSYDYKYPLEPFYWFKNTTSNYTAPDYDGDHYSATVSSTNSGINYSEWNNITSFSGGSGAIIVLPSNTPLPVELVDFSSRCMDGDVAIEWSTASENNSMHFEVESSVDAFNWEAIAVVDAAQFSTSLIDYAILHEGAAREKNYYRLKQVDTDGAYEYYSIIYSDCGSDFDGAPIIFPNPSKNNFTIDFGGSGMKGIVQLTLVSMEGKEISNRQLNLGEGVSTFQINNLELQPGLYLIKMIDVTGKLFIIKHRFN